MVFIHLGSNTVVNIKDVIAIIDMDKTTTSKNTRDFLAYAQKHGMVINVSEELPKSAIVCNYKGENRVYISQISPATLQGRYTKDK